MSNLFLIGYRGTGKTSVGRLLADRLELSFVDADDEVERIAGKSIAEIFASGGETAFRELEQQVVTELCQREDHIISLGGGAVLRSENRQAIKDSGQTVWLTASPRAIWERLNADETTGQRRPNLTSQGGLAEIETVLQAREVIYRACADVEVDTESASPDEVAAKIVERLS